MGDDPPFLPVGTDVSAKYKGAFCEAKIKKVVRNIKCKVTLKAGGTTTVNDDVIKGTLRVGNTVEVKQDPKKDATEAVITKIQDCSQYTVVFDDGDITTLRRSALCLKSGRHFNESETLDQLPLTHPEHFSTPVIAGRRGRRGRAQSEDSDAEPSTRRVKDLGEREPHVGRVVLVEAGGRHQPAFPALVVAPTPAIKVKEDYLVRSFKDGRYYTVPKKEAREFRKGSAPTEWTGVDAALKYLNDGVLPPHWDRDAAEQAAANGSDSSDDEPREEKDHFVAQLYKFMDDRGTPLNRNPTIANKDIDLYRLFRVVEKLGGYNRVTNQNQWKTIADKMGFHPVTTSITNLCKQAYKKFLHSFEDFYRKLGVTLVAHPRGARTPPAGRSLIRDRDKQPPPCSPAPAPTAAPPAAPPAAPAPTPPPAPAAVVASTPPPVTPRNKDKESDKSETEKSDKSDKSEKDDKSDKSKSRTSDGEDSADNQPLISTTPKPDKDKREDKEKEKEKEKEKDKPSTSKPKEEEEKIKPQVVRSRSAASLKIEQHEKRTPKRKSISSKESVSVSSARASRRPHVSTDSDSSGRASRCGLTKKLQSRRSQSANSASSGNTIASNSSKRPRKRKIIEPSSSSSEPTRSAAANVKAQVGDKLKVYYGPNQSESKVTYEAKVIEISQYGQLRVHYTGWNTRYDEWIKPQRIALNVTAHERNKGFGTNRRARAKRIEESSARSDTDSDSTDEEVKRPPKKVDDKSDKNPSKPKDTKSSDSSGSSKPKPRKRPLRTVSTPSNASPPKKSRPPSANSTHQGRDYDLNEIRSELKGLHTVKQEPEENTKPETPDKETPSTSATIKTEEPPAPIKVEKQAEDVYEFKEPEPFELELHDEKKKRMHRIFDDISPTKYALTLSKSLSEEISDSDPLRPRPSSLRSPSLSPFRDFSSTREPPERQSPEDDSKDGLYSLDDDSLPDDSSTGLKFEGFTPAKNQETYSKKSKVSKLRQLIDDSPDSPADDEQSSDDEQEEEDKEDERDVSPVPEIITTPKSPKSPTVKSLEQDLEDEIKASKIDKGPKLIIINNIDNPATDLKNENEIMEEAILISIPEPKTPPPKKLSSPSPLPSTSTKEILDVSAITIIESHIELPEDIPLPEPMEIDLNSIPLPPEPKEKPLTIFEETAKPIEKTDSEPLIKIIETPSSPLDTEEDKSEPDSPVRIDVLPEPPPGFLLHSEGPKIAEKLLKAINSAKRLSMSPPPSEEKPETPKLENTILPPKTEKLSPLAADLKTPKVEPFKPLKTEPIKKETECIFGEPSKIIDKIEPICSEAKKKEDAIKSPRLQSPLNILERRPSVADLPLAAGKNNKVLSDTIQKLSSQINQSVASISVPPFQPEDRSDSSDSDDSDRRLIIDKASTEEWGGVESVRARRVGAAGALAGPGGVTGGALPGAVGVSVGALSGAGGVTGGALAGLQALHAGKSPGEWSAGESLLMLEDACKNERKHSANVVVAGTGRGTTAAAEEDSNISLLLCAETIPGSPAPDAEPAPRNHHTPFACTTQNTQDKEERRVPAGAAGVGAARRGAAEGGACWGRRPPLADNTPPTTPDSGHDMSPKRDRRISERDSPSDRKEDEENRPNDGSLYDLDKPLRGRSRKASESGGGGGGGGGAARGRRRRRDTDDAPPHNYNFYVQLDPSWDCPTRINVLSTRLGELRKAYHSVKAELAAIDRRRKKLRRKEREAVKAAKAACS